MKRQAAVAFLCGCVLVSETHANESVSAYQRKVPPPPPPPPPLRSSSMANKSGEENASSGIEDTKEQNTQTPGPSGASDRTIPPPPPLQQGDSRWQQESSKEAQHGDEGDKRLMYTPLETENKRPPPPRPKSTSQQPGKSAPEDAKPLEEPRRDGGDRTRPLSFPHPDRKAPQDAKGRLNESTAWHRRPPPPPQRRPLQHEGDGGVTEKATTHEPEGGKDYQNRPPPPRTESLERQPQYNGDAVQSRVPQREKFAETVAQPSMSQTSPELTKQTETASSQDGTAFGSAENRHTRKRYTNEDKGERAYIHAPSESIAGLRTNRPDPQGYGPHRIPPSNDYQRQLPSETRFGQGQQTYVPPPGSGYPERRENIQRQPPPGVPPPGYPGQRPPPNPPNEWRPPPQTRPPPRKIDPRELHRRASAERREAAAPPAWKRLWSKIEGSLDGLADLEDTIGGKAKQLYSSTLDTAASAVKSTPVRNPQAKPTPRNQNYRWSGQNGASQKTSQGPSLAERVSRKSDPQFAARMSGTYANIHSTTPSTENYSRRQPESRAINWDDVMHKKTRNVMRANGGASQPRDGGPKATDLDISGMQKRSEPTTGSQPYPTNVEKPKSTLKQAFPQAASSAVPSYRPPSISSPTQPAPLDDEPVSWKERIGGLLPSLPRFRFRGSSLRDFSSTIDAWEAEDDASAKARGGLLRLFSRRDDLELPQDPRSSGSKDHSSLTEKVPSTLIGLEEKCTTSCPFPLLTDQERHDCIRIGRSRAFWDMSTLLFLLVGVKSLPAITASSAAGQTTSFYAETVFNFLGDFVETWAPFAFSAALLSAISNSLTDKRARNLASLRRDGIVEEARYGRLFLRLFTSENAPKSTIGDVGVAVYDQVLANVELVRLRSFVSFVILTIAFVVIRFVQPVFHAIVTALLQILELKELRHWPPEWKVIWQRLKDTSAPLLQMIVSTIKDGVDALKENPLRFAYEASIVFSLFTACLLPSVEAKRKRQSMKAEEDEDEAITENYERFTNEVLAMGTSSSTRLSLLSESVEGLLERWRLAQPPDFVQRGEIPLHSLVRMYTYGFLASAVLLIPVMVYSRIGILPALTQNQIIQWDSLFDLAVVLYFVQNIVWKTLGKVFKAKSMESSIGGFLDSICVALEQRKKQLDPPPMSLQLQAAISPLSGLNVVDLWAAHTTKRAWAVRGANFACRSGEVMLILGDEGSGKSRLLGTIAESFLSPPRGASTVTRINRGSITVGGLDVTKWDVASLRKRVGVMLNDVRTYSDKAKIFSGLTMEEILEPFDGLRTVDPSHSPTPTERACITQALHITGLNTSLLPRLPSKMSTVVTANEEDLRPSHFRARSMVLSPVEWSKVLLARVLSQAIFDNDSTAHNSDKFEKCLVGSVLLLDDVTSGVSEIDEARLLKNLRQTGAAVVITSNRWAAGRWADKIVVVRDGVIVESGTHAELLTRGSQKSLYASNWHAMASMT